jgi:hypothetical protein
MMFRPEFVHAVLWHFVWQFLLCFALASFFGAWLFFVIRHRSLWLRYTAAEAAFWHRIGLSSFRLVDASRRFYEGRGFTYVLWFIFLASCALTIFNVSMYFYWRHIFQMHAGI